MNQQEPQRRDYDPEGDLFVHNIFPTIQGEGPFAGRAAIFIRLHGCNLQCPWCDTDYTSAKEPYTAQGLSEYIHSRWPEHELVVITGGEPFRQNLSPLVRYLRFTYDVQIETNGTLCPRNDFPWDDVTIVVSPKTSTIHPMVAERAAAYKYVLQAGHIAPDGLPTAALGHPTGTNGRVARPPAGWYGPIYLQPMDAHDEDANWQNIRAVVTQVQMHKKYIMGVQMHKITGLP